MSCEQLKFNIEDGSYIIFKYENDKLFMIDSNISGKFEFKQAEAHMLYLYLKERFEK